MARDTQTPLDEEIERAARDAEPQVEEFENELQNPDDAQDALNAIEAEADAENIIEADTQALTAQIEELEQRLAETRDQALRAVAETQNVRRRSEQEVDKARKYALEKFVKELLPVVDSLEKALEAMQEEASDAHREGVSMTLKMQLDALKKFGVEVVDPQGEPFDPQYHEAMAMVPNPELDPNTVMEVIQKGYLLNDRLVRPAMVVVSQAAK